MIIKIENGIGKYDLKELVITKLEDLTIEFSGLEFSGQAFFVGQIKNSKFTKQIKNNSVTVESNLIKVGSLKSYIEIRQDDYVIKKINIENLTINQIGYEFELIPEIEELKKYIGKLEDKVTDYKSKVETLSADIETLLKIVNVLAGTDIKLGE